MTELEQIADAAQRTRRRAMIIPREHGAWGLLLVPLFTGWASGFAPKYRTWDLVTFTLAALSLFALRTPLESLLGTNTISARTSSERRAALIGVVAFAVLAGGCLTLLMWKGHYPGLFVLGAASACAFTVQAVLRRLGRSSRTISQVVGAVALTSAAPAACYIGTGRLDGRALSLWAVNWLFASNQIHFVQLRIHAARATMPHEKLESGKSFLWIQGVSLVALITASLLRVVPSFSIVSFAPALARASSWFFRKSAPFNVRSLGWSEMRQGVAFAMLLAFAFLYRQ